MFSNRTGWRREPNRFSSLLAEMRRSGEVLDLTVSNPTAVGFRHPGADALAPLGATPPGYAPAACGLLPAREAVAAYYAERGIAVPPDRVLLTASTSEAYGFLFKLLADSGDEALVPEPSYPLLDYLAGLEGIRLVRYPCHYDAVWSLDVEGLRRAITNRTRAIVLVSPNNPTGALLTEEELHELDSLAAEHDLALICDEVFSDFLFAPDAMAAAPSAATALTFTLSGLSKVCGLPQAKLGWMVVDGPHKRVAEALERLELIADTYLSVASPVQLATPALLAARGPFQAECRSRLRHNWQVLGEMVSEAPSVERLVGDGGWSACLRVPRIQREEDLVLELLRTDRIAVHPGYFFDFPEEAYLVVSLLVEEERFADGIYRLLNRVG